MLQSHPFILLCWLKEWIRTLVCAILPGQEPTHLLLFHVLLERVPRLLPYSLFRKSQTMPFCALWAMWSWPSPHQRQALTNFAIPLSHCTKWTCCLLDTGEHLSLIFPFVMPVFIRVGDYARWHLSCKKFLQWNVWFLHRYVYFWHSILQSHFYYLSMLHEHARKWMSLLEYAWFFIQVGLLE